LHRDIEASIPCTVPHARMHAQVPKGCQTLEMIVELRSALVEEGEIPLTIQKALENTFCPEEPVGPAKAQERRLAEEAA